MRLAIIAFVATSMTTAARGELFINEIYFDPPGSSGDNSQEYIEIRGTPNMSLNDHYLILLETENVANDTGDPGQVDFIFDLNGRSLSPTGFLTLRQKASPYTSVPNDAFNPINTGTGNFWGTTAADNNVGARSSLLYSSDPGKIENSGFTAMVVRVNSGGAAPR